MAFHFNLEPVLTVRKNREEQAQLKLAREQMILRGHEMRLSDLHDRRLELAGLLEEKKKKTLAAGDFLFLMESMRVFELQIHILGNTIAAQQRVVERMRAELAEAVKQRKIVDHLREKALLSYLDENRRKEQKESDEQALLRHGRERLL